MRWKFRICLYASFFVGVFAAAQTSSINSHIDSKKIVDVHISQQSKLRSEQLKKLKKFDFMGINSEANVAQYYVSSDEMNEVRQLGFVVDSRHVNFDLDNLTGYLSPKLLTEKLVQLEQTHPNLLKVSEAGKSHRGNSIWLAELTSQQLPIDEKPSLLFNAMHHAREVMTTEVAVHLIEKLIRDYENGDAEAVYWLDHYRVLVVPQVNPDGNDFVHNGQPMWRKNAWQSQGRTFGVDINRNYPENWNKCNGSSGNKNAADFRGPSAASEPEVQTMMKLVGEYKPVFNISYHSYSELILYPFGCRNETNTAVEFYKSIAADMKKNTIDDTGRANTYKTGTPPELLYAADGGDMDWQWRAFGVISFAMEVNSSLLGFAPNYAQWRQKTVERLEGSWKTLLRRMSAGAVRAKIEVAGSNGNLKNITYKIKTQNHVEWADSDVADLSLRNSSGLFFQALLPGVYTIQFQKNGQTVREVPISIDNATLDLGNIVL